MTASDPKARAEVQELRPGRSLNMLVLDGGSSPAATVFLCHGAGGSLNQWRRQVPALEDAGCRVVAWDFPGHGGSGRGGPRARFAGAELLEDFRVLLQRHAAGPVVIAGHSYGVILTLALLVRLKEEGRLDQVTGVLLLGPPGPGARLSRSPLATTPLPLLWLMRPMLSRGFRRAAWDPSADPALVRDEQRATRGNRLSMMAALMAQALTLEGSDLAALDVPVSIYAGASDQLTPPQAARDLAGRLPRARLEVLERCGHQIMLERPEIVTDALLQLVRGAADPRNLPPPPPA